MHIIFDSGTYFSLVISIDIPYVYLQSERKGGFPYQGRSACSCVFPLRPPGAWRWRRAHRGGPHFGPVYTKHTPTTLGSNYLADNTYGYATEYKKSVHAKCFLNSWYFRGYGPGYGMLFRLFYGILRYSPLFSDQNDSSISNSRYFFIFCSVPVV